MEESLIFLIIEEIHMDFELLLFSTKTQEEYGYYLKEIVEKNLKADFTFEHNKDNIILCFRCMTICLDLEEILGLDVVEEEFGFKANISADIQVFSNFHHDALDIIFRIIKEIIIKTDYNLLLLGNGSNVIIKKDSGKFYSSDLKDYYFDFPFEILKVDIEKL